MISLNHEIIDFELHIKKKKYNSYNKNHLYKFKKIKTTLRNVAKRSRSDNYHQWQRDKTATATLRGSKKYDKYVSDEINKGR